MLRSKNQISRKTESKKTESKKTDKETIRAAQNDVTQDDV